MSNTLVRWLTLSSALILISCGGSGGGGGGTNPPPPSPLSITTNSLPSGIAGQLYTATVLATGGTTPYTWSIASGTLPTGLSLTTSTGAISGTPAAAGSSSFTVKVTDSGSQSASEPLSIAVNSALGITTTSLPNGIVGSAYSSTLAATGGTTPYTWSISSGSLPTGLSLTTFTGAISGTPAAAETSAFTVQVKDSGSPAQSASEPFTITVAPPSPDFSITVLSTSDTTVSDQKAASIIIELAALNAFSGSVTVNAQLPQGFSSTGLPFTASLASNQATQSITVAVDNSVGPGQVSLTFTATSGALSHSASWSVTVNAIGSFSLSVSDNQNQDVATGAPVTVTVKVTATGPGDVTLSAQLPSGFASTPALPVVVSAGQSAVLAIAVDDTVIAGSYPLSFSGTGGGHTNSATYSLNVLGNGTITFNFDSSIPQADQDFMNSVLPYMYQYCGRPLYSETVEVSYNPYAVTETLFGWANGADQIQIVLSGFGVPGGEAYEIGHVINDSGVFDITSPYPGVGFEDSFSQACNDIVGHVLASQGNNAFSIGNGDVSYTMIIWGDAEFSWDPLKVLAIGGQRTLGPVGEEPWFMLAAMGTPPGTSAGEWSRYSLAPFMQALARAAARKGVIHGPQYPSYPKLHTNDLENLFNEVLPGISIDGQPPGSWFGSVPDFLSEPTTEFQAGQTFFGLTVQNPSSSGAEFGSTLLQVVNATPPLSGLSLQYPSVTVNMSVKDITGADAVLPFTQSTGVISGISLNPGAYTLIAQTTYNDQAYQDKAVAISVPSDMVVPFGEELPYPGLYVAAVDSNGNATNSNFVVSGGTLVWHSGGAAIVDCAPAGEVPASCTINGRTFSQPRPASRSVTVPAM